jgi:tetraacyldisaccharide-1-P 4'-kinase
MRNASNSGSGGRLRAPLDNTSAAAAVMAQGKLSTEAGMAAAHQAAQQAKQRAQKQQQEELCAAALTPPQQRTQEQVSNS